MSALPKVRNGIFKTTFILKFANKKHFLKKWGLFKLIFYLEASQNHSKRFEDRAIIFLSFYVGGADL